MKSTRKTFYNHRIAQSKEKWETDFLSKIDNANDLLYLAAVKSNNYSPVKDNYYTAENKPKIKSTLEDIVNNPYNQRWHKNFADMKNAALDLLDKKTQGQSSDTSTKDTLSVTETPTVTESLPFITTDNSKEQDNSPFGQLEIGQFPKVQSPIFDPERENFTEEAKTILSQLDDIDLISDKNPDQFGREWLNLEKNIYNQLDIATRNNKINIKESSNIKAKLENLSNKWAILFYPGGFKRLKNGTIIPTDVKDATSSLIEQLKTNPDTEKVDKLREVYQKAFLDKKSIKDQELFGNLTKLNIEINRRNTNDRFEGKVNRLVMSTDI